MKYLTNILIASLCWMNFTDCHSENQELDTAGKKYCNPVVNYSLPDPTVIHTEDGFFYLYATEDIHNIPILRSKDLVNWTEIGTAFTNASRPTFEPKGGLWAPDI